MPQVLSSLALSGFRNYREPLDLTFEHAWFGVTGPNGSGKTNLLESIFFLARRCGFRGQTWTKMRAWDTEKGFVQGVFSDGDRRIEWQDSQVQYLQEGDSVTSRRTWAVRYPIFGYRPDDDLFFHQEPQARRKYLDWLCSYLQPNYIALVADYEHVLKQRNAALRDPRVREAEFVVWERDLARLGCALYTARHAAIEQLNQYYLELWQHLEREPAMIRYRNGGGADMARVQQVLAEKRPDDQQRGWTGFGPHRDDVLIYRQDRLLRESGSQGYRKLGVLLLSAACAMAAKPNGPTLFYMDDIEGELDDENEQRLFRVLATLPFQVFLSGVRRPRVLANMTDVPKIQWLDLT